MADPRGFMTHPRLGPLKRSVEERVRDYAEIETPMSRDQLEVQASRCMDCGVPFCHTFGCPVSNVIPELNDLVYRKQWRRALDVLHSTNNMPEVTGRVCPALCEAACTLSLNQPSVSIRQIELQVVRRAGSSRSPPGRGRAGRWPWSGLAPRG